MLSATQHNGDRARVPKLSSAQNDFGQRNRIYIQKRHADGQGFLQSTRFYPGRHQCLKVAFVLLQ